MSRFANLRKYLGLTEAINVYRQVKFGDLNNISISKLRHPFGMRKNPFDYVTFEEVVLTETYNIPVDFEPRYIIDGGGNIGLTAAFFGTKFSKAEIITIEPDKENHELLSRNIKSYPNIKSLNKGVWYRPATLMVKDSGAGNNSFTVEEVLSNTAGAIEAVGIESIVEQNNWPYIDILKLDIEGSEKEVFSLNYESWLPKTKVLIIELHDRMKPGCSKALFTAVNQYNFSFSISGENLVFVNENRSNF